MKSVYSSRKSSDRTHSSTKSISKTTSPSKTRIINHAVNINNDLKNSVSPIFTKKNIKSLSTKENINSNTPIYNKLISKQIFGGKINTNNAVNTVSQLSEKIGGLIQKGMAISSNTDILNTKFYREHGYTALSRIYYLALMHKHNKSCKIPQLYLPIAWNTEKQLKQLAILYGLPIEQYQKWASDFYEKNGLESVAKAVLTETQKCSSKGINVIGIRLSWGQHSNILIYKVKENKVYHFEPHGEEFYGNIGEHRSINKQYYNTIEALCEYINPDIQYLRPDIVCPIVGKGFQALEAVGNKKIWGDLFRGHGYCSIWTMFFLDMVLSHPEFNITELQGKILKTLNSNQDIKLFYLILGYIEEMKREVGKYMRKFKGKEGIDWKHDSTNEYLHNYDEDNMNTLRDISYKVQKMITPENSPSI